MSATEDMVSYLTMKLLLSMLILVVLQTFIKAEQNQYQVITENLTVAYLDQRYIDLSLQLVQFKQTIVYNITFTMKVDLPEKTMLPFQAWKWLGNEYHIPTLQMKKTVKEVLDMESFDLQSFFVRYAKPPVVWPIKKDMIYRLEGWTPDSTKFPPNLPDGKWKVVITEQFPNKTRTFTANWYFIIKYYR